jgi:acyl-CoA synthetase (AMP-forming)/AMP-acid ligase II
VTENRASWRDLINAPHLRPRERYLADWRAQGLQSAENLPVEIAAGAARAPATPLVFGSKQRLCVTTTGEMLARAEKVARAFYALGLRAGDILVSQLPNWAEGMETAVAALKLGLVQVPVVDIYGSAELRFILGETKARAFVLPGSWRSFDFAERVAALAELPDLEHVIVLGDAPMPRPVVRWDEMLGLPAEEVPQHSAAADDVVMLNFTSGTTGSAKGVVHSHATLGGEVRRIMPAPTAADDGKLMFWAGPAGHIGGIVGLLRPFLMGEGTVYIDRFDAELALSLIRSHPVGRIAGAPVAINAVLDKASPEDLASMVGLCSGGAAVPPALVYRGEALGVPVIRSYGSTEHPTVTFSEFADPVDQRALTDGRPSPGNRVRIMDDDGAELPAGAAGEIVTMGPELFLGYLDPAQSAASFTDDGWFRTGDIGVVDEQGFLTVVDRKKDIIIRGGENISSKEVEDVLARHPAIEEAAAVPWPDEVYGERVGAFIRLRRGATLDLAEVRAHFRREGVAVQKTPERIVIVDEFPRTPFGKILKRELRQGIPALGKDVIMDGAAGG